MTFTMTTVFARNENCPVRKIGEGLVIMAPKGDVTHSLEDLGAFIWQNLDGQRDLNAVLEAITKAYDVDREVAETDLRSFVSELLDSEIVVQMS